MLKYTLVLLLIVSSLPSKGDATGWKPGDIDWKPAREGESPRTVWSDGKSISPFLRKAVHDRDLDPNGWKYNINEWMHLDAPHYRKHSIYGSNHGWELA